MKNGKKPTVKDAMAKALKIAAKFGAMKEKPPSLFALKANGVGELYFYDQFGGSWFSEGITAPAVKEALAAMKGVSQLNVFVNSPGGDVFEGKAIHSLLRRFAEGGAKVHVHVDGLAASAASFVAMAGDHITTAPYATWMIHNAWTVAAGGAEDFRKLADLLDDQNGDIAGIYAARTGQDLASLRTLMDAETWMTADEAKRLGFTDEVAEPNRAPSEEDDEEDEDEKEEKAAAKLSKTFAALVATRARLALERTK